jgi:hypothetical protein
VEYLVVLEQVLEPHPLVVAVLQELKVMAVKVADTQVYLPALFHKQTLF